MTSAGPSGIVEPLRVMSLNLRRDVPADGPNAWPHRAPRVGALVDREMPHLLGTQEGLPHQLADLDARLPRYARVGSCRDGDGRGEHVAIHYDPARLLLVAGGDVWLSETPDVPGSRSWGNRLPRHATWARFTDQPSGASFTAVNTHLDHESAAARTRAAAFLAARFPGALLMGDFNEAPGDGVFGHVLPGRRDPLAEVADGTYHAYSGVARDRIDHVLLPAAWAVAGARVLRPRPVVSDHDPVVVDAWPTVPEATSEALAP